MSGPLRLSIALTAVFVVVTVAGLVTTSAYWTVEAVDLALFGLGVAAMIAAFGIGVSRSRTESVTPYGLFLGADGALPKQVRLGHFAVLATQVVVGFGGAILGGGGSMAFGVLVAQCGLGFLAFDSARNGHFDPATSGNDRRGPTKQKST